jgi:hypothetical protein
VGNCLATAVMARWEGVLGTETAAPPIQPARGAAPVGSDA